MGGGVLALLLSSRVLKVQGELTSWSSSVEPMGVQPTLSFYSPRWGPLGRLGEGMLDPGDLLGQRMILAIFLGNCNTPVLILVLIL